MINLHNEKIFNKWKNSSYGNDELQNSIAYNYDINCNDPEIQLWFMIKEDIKYLYKDIKEGKIHKYSLAIRNPIKQFKKEDIIKYGFSSFEIGKSDEGYQMLWTTTNNYNELVEFLEKYYSHTLNKEN